MASISEARLANATAYIPAVAEKLGQYREIYGENYQRLYCLAFWMTNDELAAEEVVGNAFRRAFSLVATPGAEVLDRALLRELREQMPVGPLTLECADVTEVAGIRRSAKRIHLEEAVVQLPATERLIFLMHDVEACDHSRISRTIGLSEDESRRGLHQARLRMRELLAGMI